MLCPKCASELSADATLCGKCGANLDSHANPLVLTPPAASETPPPAAIDPSAISAINLPAISVPTIAAPPYAIFVSQVLGLALCLSVVVFTAADNLAHGYWRILPSTVVASLVAIVFMVRMPSTWHKIEAADEPSDAQKKILRLSVIFVLLFLATAGIVGSAIGRSGKETAQIVSDFEQMTRVGSRISQARSSVERTVPAHIDMYKAIEADVDDLDDVLQRLQAELPTYDDRFPDQHEQTTKSISSIEIGLKRAALLKQQITVARDIEALGPDPQWKAWQDRMEPLLDAETALDKH